MLKLLQAGAVPFRYEESQPKFLLVTSKRGNWIFPKGVVEPGHTAEETAHKETLEEAGVLGRVFPEPLGSYSDRKAWNNCRVQMYLMRYHEDSPNWDESAHRAKRWCSFESALDLIKKKELRDILRLAWKRLRNNGNGNGSHEPTSVKPTAQN